MLIKIKSTSPLFHSIIKNMDDTLSSIPVMDHEGCDTEDSMSFDSYISAIENCNVKDKDGRYHYPANKTLAIVLLYDEVKSKRKQGDKMSLVKKTIELFGEPVKITNKPNYDDAFKVIEQQFENIIKVTDATGEVLKSTKDLCKKTLHMSIEIRDHMVKLEKRIDELERQKNTRH